MKKFFSFLFIFLLVFCVGVSGDCEVVLLSSLGLPVENAPVSVVDLSSNVSLLTNSTDAAGAYFFVGNCSNISLVVSIPSSNYSAVLSNGSISSVVPLNDFVSARVQLKNTLGVPLEAQDCSVNIFDDSSVLVFSYDTLCRQGEPYIDSSGNWASFSKCPFTDSQGWYYFRGEVKEPFFDYAHNYSLQFVCNGQNYSMRFSTGLEKHTDLNKYAAMVEKQGGVIALYVIGGLFLLLLLAFVLWVLFGRKKGKKDF